MNKKVIEIKNTNPNYEIITFRNKTGTGLEGIKKILESGMTYCLLGSSGVGKTTLINSLIGEKVYTTGAVRKKDAKGRHITTSRQLIILKQGGIMQRKKGEA